MREYCDRIEEAATGDPENERSLHHAFRSAIEAAYIESVAAGASPVAAAKSGMRTAREYIFSESCVHQVPVFDGLIAPESSVHDWFTAVNDITPHVIRNRLAQNTISSSSSSTDRSARLNGLYNMVIGVFFHDVHQNFNIAIGNTLPPPYLNRVCNDMAIETTRFANHPGASDINPARSIEEANDVLSRAFQGIAIEVSNLRTTESAAVPILAAEPTNENIPVVADAVLIGSQKNAAVVMDDDGPVIAELIPEYNFVDPDEEGELIPSRFNDETDGPEETNEEV